MVVGLAHRMHAGPSHASTEGRHASHTGVVASRSHTEQVCGKKKSMTDSAHSTIVRHTMAWNNGTVRTLSTVVTTMIVATPSVSKP